MSKKEDRATDALIGLCMKCPPEKIQKVSEKITKVARGQSGATNGYIALAKSMEKEAVKILNGGDIINMKSNNHDYQAASMNMLRECAKRIRAI